MEDDRISTATMTSVTEDLSLDETDTSSNDIDTSSQITSSDAINEGDTTVVYKPPLDISVKQEEQDVVDVNMEAESEQDDSAAIFDEPKPTKHTPVSQPSQKTKPSAHQSSNQSRPSDSGLQYPDWMSMQGKWYEHECFNHYWRHYHYVSMWCQKHMETYKSVVEQYNMTMTHQTAVRQQTAANSTEPANTFRKPINKKTIRNRKARRRRKNAKKRMKMALRNGDVAANCSTLSQSSEEEKPGQGETTESAVEGAEKEEDMQITEELLDFFAHTHKHRQERDALKSKEGEKEEKHINIGEGEGMKKRTSSAPAERPGSKRTSEMRLLYGKGAAMIHGMETALQMTFDRNSDVLQPRLWPNMPLRVIF
ncbi:gem-associated protein 8-like [Babylonia areolata]|uniref:gem-associated protein 8-like n=1 Tax=Babylonia areolata TaxID=304850 RepID=UPI003FD18D83